MPRLSKVKRTLWSAFMDEAKANRLYIAYAQRADEEGHPEIAAVFRKVADAETRHALSHLNALGEIKTSAENLRSVLELERYEAEEVFPRMLEAVRDAGNPKAVESMELALREGREHLEEFAQALKLLQAKGAAPAPAAAPARVEPPPSSLSKNTEVQDEKKRIAGLERIRELVFGMQDGVVSTMAVASSVMIATGETFPTLAAGLAAGISGTIAMSTGSFLASKSEHELHSAEIDKESLELQERPEEEVAELVDLYRQEGFSYEEASHLAERVASDPKLLLKTLTEKELGLAAEVGQVESPWLDAATMGVSFFTGSMVSLLPYLVWTGATAVRASVASCLGLLFLVGVVKTKVTHKNPWISGLEVMGIGTFSALFGYGLGKALPGVFDRLRPFLP